MSDLTSAERMRRLLSSFLGVELPLVQAQAKQVGPRLEVTVGGWHGDPWSGGVVATRIDLRDAVHPESAGPLRACLEYQVHDLSGQVDAWVLTLAGFPAAEASALREELDPFARVPNLNSHLEYRWVIDKVAGVARRPPGT